MRLEQLLARLRQETALNLDLAGVDRAVRQRLRLLRSHDREAYLQRLLAQGDDAEYAALIDLLVVPETWFFRDPAAFSAAARLVGERLARDAGRPVRILSLPCSTGEEPYTIAMALLDAGIPRSAFAIEAIDLSRAAIDHARRGLYGDYAFRAQDLSFRDRHFTHDGNAYALHADVREAVQFSQGNLLAEKAGAPYDLVFCRNLLIYFDEPTQQRALRELDRLLAAEGWLFTAYAELAVCCRQKFEMRSLHGTHALTRPSAASRRVAGAGLPGPQASPPPQRTRLAVVSSPAPLAAPCRPAAAVLPEQARQLADRGNIDEAARAYAAILEAQPESSEAAFMLALLSERQARPELAEKYFRRTAYLDPDHYEALCHLALLAERRGDVAAGAAYRHRAARVYRRRAAGSLTG